MNRFATSHLLRSLIVMINNDNQTPAAHFACLAILRIFHNQYQNRQTRTACTQSTAEQPAKALSEGSFSTYSN